MIKFSKCIPFALMLATLVGCNVGIKGSGVSKTESRNVADFKSVSSEAVGDVNVTIGDSQSVEVTIDDNLLPLLVTEVVDGVLKVKTTGSFSTSIGLKVNVTTPSLDSIHSSGVGNIKIEGLDSEQLAVELSGVGGVTAKGKVQNLDVTVSGVGSANLRELLAENVSVTVSGVGGAEVYASKSVNASTSGVGSIKVFGNPAEKKENKSGIGSIKFE
ncbi:MAG: head GIN domain-containing protein [Pirellula sp.]|jgi:hypothetical protein